MCEETPTSSLIVRMTPVPGLSDRQSGGNGILHRRTRRRRERSGTTMASSTLLPSRPYFSLLLFVIAFMLAGVPLVDAQTSGADLEASISGPPRVRIGENITYTVTATNIGDQTATGVMVDALEPDWMNPVSQDCLTGTLVSGECRYPDLAPDSSVSMTITLQANPGNKAERRKFELGFVSATNDVNPSNDQAEIDVQMIGPCKCGNNKKFD
jgi:uncharacterized repeat protein (TIGR01451 family)